MFFASLCMILNHNYLIILQKNTIKSIKHYREKTCQLIRLNTKEGHFFLATTKKIILRTLRSKDAWRQFKVVSRYSIDLTVPE